jgi:hypothetical protein
VLYSILRSQPFNVFDPFSPETSQPSFYEAVGVPGLGESAYKSILNIGFIFDAQLSAAIKVVAKYLTQNASSWAIHIERFDVDCLEPSRTLPG